MYVARLGEGTINVTLMIFSIKEDCVVRCFVSGRGVIANFANGVMAKNGNGVAVKKGNVKRTVVVANGTKDPCVECCVGRCGYCETCNCVKARIGNWYVSTEKLHLMIML